MYGEFTPLRVEVLKRGQMKLLEDFTYYHKSGVSTTVVPAGYQCDGVSIRMLRNTGFFVFHSLMTGYGTRAAVIHDWCYEKAPNGMTRLEADLIFKESLRSGGLSRWRTLAFYYGVRLLARPAWIRHRSKD